MPLLIIMPGDNFTSFLKIMGFFNLGGENPIMSRKGCLVLIPMWHSFFHTSKMGMCITLGGQGVIKTSFEDSN